MKILHVIDSGGLYGAEIMLLNLVEEQIVLGLKPVIASIGDHKTAEKPLEREALMRGFPLIFFRMAPGPNVSGAYRLLKYAREEGFDLIHSHGYKGNILLGFIPRVFRRIPLVSTLHGYTSIEGITKMRLYEWLDTLSHKMLDAVVLVNLGMLNHPKIKKQKKIKFHVINNGIPVQKADKKKEKKPRTGSETLTIGSIGRLSTEKGYTFLIEAFSLLIRKGVDARLVLIGDGYERPLLEECVKRHNLWQNVEFTGYMRNAKQYMDDFDIYAISSLTEGLPITLLEAMAARTPVVATAVGGIPDVIENNREGLLVPPCNPQSMADSFFKLSKDPLFSSQLADKAYDKLIRIYSSRKMAEEYRSLYLSIIQKRTR
jgi:glycosyltransferase involved in cell wall biosynthesis